jgi:ribosomal protein S18 acetylase RimI-like enzyme
MSTPEPAAVAPTFRLLTVADIPEAQRLRELAGWNQTCQDWENLLAFEPNGCFAAIIEDKLVGTATTTRYLPASGPGSFGWIGMVLVDPEYRRYGIGSALLNKCISYLQNSGVETVKLDATPLGKKVYDKLGFKDEFRIERWEGTAAAAADFVQPGHISISLSSSQDIVTIDSFDAKVFGANRRAIRQGWRAQWPEMAFVARINEKIVGYSLARRGTHFQHIGPVIGDTPEVCETLLQYALSQIAGQKIIIDVVTENVWAAELLSRSGLKLQRPLIRMYLGPNCSPGQRDKIFAGFCPELG